MAVATTAVGAVFRWLMDSEAGKAVATGPLGNWAHQVAEAARRKGWAIIAGRFSEGQLPANHHIARASRTSLGRALQWMAHQLSDQPPPALRGDILRRLERGELARDIEQLQVPAAYSAWLKALIKLSRDDQQLQQLERRSLGAAEVRHLLQSQTDASAAAELHQRARAWMAANLAQHGPEPEQLDDFLGRGWLLPGNEGRLTLYQAWCWFFRESVKDEPKVFNSFVATTLADLLEPDDTARAEQVASTSGGASAIDFADAFAGYLEGPLRELLALSRETLDTVTRIETTAHDTAQATREVKGGMAQVQHILATSQDTQATIQTAVAETLQIVKRLDTPQPPPDCAGPVDTYPVFVGLRPYRRKDAPYFFGREREVDEYLALIASASHQTLLLKGRSGVGKSSLMLAGVLPKLPGRKSGKVRNYLFMAPGADPFLSLVRAVNLRASSSQERPEASLKTWAGRLASSIDDFVRLLETEIASTAKRVLYIDQLEELLIESSADPAGQEFGLARKRAFLSGLTAFLDHDRERNFVLASLREDYADKMASDGAWSALTRLFERGMVRWLRLPDHDATIDEMVLGPCKRACFSVDPDLLAAVRIDIRQLRGGWPPLLSASMEEIVRVLREDPQQLAARRLTLAQYRAVGGLRDIVQRRARFTEDELDADQLGKLPKLFARLVRIDQQTGRPTKERMPLAQIAKELHPLVDLLLRERLLCDEGAVELVHDALFEAWPTLSRWIKRNRESLLDSADFSGRARIWSQLQQPARKLARDDDLSDAFGELRQGTLEAMERDRMVKQWVRASRRDELFKHLGTTTVDPEVWRLPLLVASGIRLDAPLLAALTDASKPFYYALCPDEIPDDLARGATSEKTGMTSDFGATQQSEDAKVDKLRYFQAEHLDLTMGRTAEYRIHHYAALGGRIDVLERLRQLGAHLDQPSTHGRVATELATVGGHVDTVRYLLGHCEDPAAAVLAATKDSKRHAVHTAAIEGVVGILQLLLETVAPDVPVDTPDSAGWTPLLMATYRGHEDFLAAFLSSGRADLRARNEYGDGVLSCAIRNKHYRFARQLVETLEPDVLKRNCEAGEEARNAPLGILTELWSEAADKAECATIEALFCSLLERDADTDLRIGKDKLPLLSYAARSGAHPLIAALIPHVDLNATDANGWTALNHALEHRHETAALLLIDPPDRSRTHA